VTKCSCQDAFPASTNLAEIGSLYEKEYREDLKHQF
jgi:hypothetical protein